MHFADYDGGHFDGPCLLRIDSSGGCGKYDTVGQNYG
jgi:hypothetical protein